MTTRIETGGIETGGTVTGGVVTIGETLALLTPRARLVAGGTLELGVGGAESNVAIALARLGVPATWVSRLGDDALGAAVLRELRAEGVDVVAAHDPGAPTGVMLKELYRGRPRRVRYYRAGSAASRLGPRDIDAVAGRIAVAAALHLTGITAALGPGPRAALRRAVEIAREAGVVVSVDINHRRTLWSDIEAAPVLRRLVGTADIVFAGPDEAALVLGMEPPASEGDGAAGEQLATALAGLGPRTAVLKLGARGALASTDGRRVTAAPARAVTMVDPVGAGDAFVGGYLAAIVGGADVVEALRLGNVLGGAVCEVAGDWEGLPTRGDLDAGDLTEVIR